jgi:cell division protein FtsI/penicillin-binding protein 2
VSDPEFVMLVRINHPRDVTFAESTAAPLFGDIAKFLLHYLHIAPDRVE